MQWAPEEQTAFDELKKLLVTALRQCDKTEPYVIRKDSSNHLLGAVLLQGEGEDEHPVEYASRLLNAAERNHSTSEREALAVVWALGKSRGYIEGSQMKLNKPKFNNGLLIPWFNDKQRDTLPILKIICDSSKAPADIKN
ncbi:hypothetical protein JTB14_029495 [Gonioctena quinquepunctata]|nr:hypothetical protein JTB14_029495 [Gonioctena quinquepunctata]